MIANISIKPAPRNTLTLAIFLHTLFIVFLQSISLHAQEVPLPITSNASNFFELQDEMNAHFKEFPGQKSEKHWRRYESFFEPRLYPHGDVSHYQKVRAKAINTIQTSLDNAGRSPHGQWSFLGPSSSTSNNFGRCVRVRFHPVNPNTLYVLTTSAGLWKSTNLGTTWTNLTEHLPYLFGVDFAIDYTDPDRIYLLTGNSKQFQYGVNDCQGLYITNDGGNTWELNDAFLGQTAPFWAFRLVMHPTNPQIMYAGTTRGIFKTTNGWQNNEQLTTYFDVFDIEFKPGDPSIVYASSRNGFYRSVSNGDLGTWSKVDDPNLALLSQTIRTEIAVTPDQPGCVYLVAAGGITDLVARSLSDGALNTWAIRDTVTDLWSTQPSYNMGVTVDPNNFQSLFVMAIALWKSDNGGAPGGWTDKNGIHADHHDLTYFNGDIYDVNDGGIGRSTDGGDSWTNITRGIEVFEAYTIAGTPQNPDLLYTGAQDVGSSRVDTAGELSGVCGGCTGDVVASGINYTNEDKSWLAAWKGGIRITEDGWSSYQDAGSGGLNFEPEFGDGIFLCPYEMDPVNPNWIFTGKDTMWRLDISAYTSQYLGDPDGVATNSEGDTIITKTSKIAQGTNNRNRMYIIHSGKVYRTDQALTTSPSGATWTLIQNDLVTDQNPYNLTVNPLNANELYLVYSGLNDGVKVYRSNNSGNTGSWVDISGNLPNVPINCINFHDNGMSNRALYIGTDIGVFYRDDDLGDWVFFGQDLPSVPVSDMYINTTSNHLVIATVGRGIWKSDLFSSCPAVHFLLPDASLSGTRYFSAFQHILSSTDYDDNEYTKVVYQAANYIDMVNGFDVHAPAFFQAQIGGCSALFLDE